MRIKYPNTGGVTAICRIKSQYKQVRDIVPLCPNLVGNTANLTSLSTHQGS